jgi:acid phosphatase
MGKRSALGYAGAGLLAVLVLAGSALADCPAVPEPKVPSPPMPLNIGTWKTKLVEYHDGQYTTDLSAVFALAQSFVEQRADQVKFPAVVLDIDETSLSNWPNIKASDFGFVLNGRCDDLPNGPCGFNDWILSARAEVIEPALKFFKAARNKGVAVVFITGRRDNQRQATLWNLDRAGYQGWEKLITRPDRDEFKTARAYKSAARGDFFVGSKFTLIANIGDQVSDLEQEPGMAAGKAECVFKLSNPFYLIP